jgi:predicted metal-dependent peptidase
MNDNELDLSERLMKARCRLLTMEPWYGTMASMFRWKPNEAVGTMGVRIVDGGYVDCYFNTKWCEGLTVEQLMGVIKHEIEHIVRLHCVRTGSREPELFNIAADMVINGKKNNPRIKDLPGKHVTMPDDYQEDITTEDVYARLEQSKVIINCPQCGTNHGKGQGKQGQGQGSQQPSQGQGQGQGSKSGQHGHGNCPGTKTLGSGANGKTVTVEGDLIDDHDVWAGSSVSEDEARQVVRDMCNQAGIRAGNAPGHLQGEISKLADPVIHWKYVLRQYIGRQVGGKRRTWSRINRRNPIFGTKGKSNHASVPLTVGVDTSGSVDDKRLEQFFTELETMSQRFKITLVQFDHGYQCHDRYHRGDWRRIKVKGRGGTSFIEYFKAIEEKGLVGSVNLVLSDGEAPWPEARKYPVLWVLMPHGRKEQVTPPWGDVLFIE